MDNEVKKIEQTPETAQMFNDLYDSVGLAWESVAKTMIDNGHMTTRAEALTAMISVLTTVMAGHDPEGALEFLGKVTEQIKSTPRVANLLN